MVQVTDHQRDSWKWVVRCRAGLHRDRRWWAVRISRPEWDRRSSILPPSAWRGRPLSAYSYSWPVCVCASFCRIALSSASCAPAVSGRSWRPTLSDCAADVRALSGVLPPSSFPVPAADCGASESADPPDPRKPAASLRCLHRSVTLTRTGWIHLVHHCRQAETRKTS